MEHPKGSRILIGLPRFIKVRRETRKKNPRDAARVDRPIWWRCTNGIQHRPSKAAAFLQVSLVQEMKWAA